MPKLTSLASGRGRYNVDPPMASTERPLSAQLRAAAHMHRQCGVGALVARGRQIYTADGADYLFAADEFLPSDAGILDREHIRGIVTAHGGTNAAVSAAMLWI